MPCLLAQSFCLYTLLLLEFLDILCKATLESVSPVNVAQLQEADKLLAALWLQLVTKAGMEQLPLIHMLFVLGCMWWKDSLWQRLLWVVIGVAEVPLMTLHTFDGRLPTGIGSNDESPVPIWTLAGICTP